MSICWSIDSWHVDLISSSFILLVLKPEICIIPVFFSSITSPYVVNSSPVNFLPGSALISFGSKSLLGSQFSLSSLCDSELGAALSAAPDDMVTLGIDFGDSPRLWLNFGKRLGLPLLVDSIFGIILGTALGDIVVLENELGESPRLGKSLSPS